MKAIGLVVVCGGAAYAHAPDHVDLRIVDTDNLNDRGEPKVQLPKDVGFGALVAEAGIKTCVEFV